MKLLITSLMLGITCTSYATCLGLGDKVKINDVHQDDYFSDSMYIGQTGTVTGRYRSGARKCNAYSVFIKLNNAHVVVSVCEEHLRKLGSK